MTWNGRTFHDYLTKVFWEQHHSELFQKFNFNNGKSYNGYYDVESEIVKNQFWIMCFKILCIKLSFLNIFFWKHSKVCILKAF